MADLPGTDGTTCLKCGHVRLASDAGPSHSCPRCGAVYAKVLEARRTQQAAVPPRPASTAGVTVDQLPRNEREAAGYRLSQKADRRDALIAHVVYLLFAIPLGTAFIGVIVAHVMRHAGPARWLDAHFKWQIKTFWWGLCLLLAVFVASTVLTKLVATPPSVLIVWLQVAGLLYTLLVLWLLYRLIKGWVQLFRGRDV